MNVPGQYCYLISSTEVASISVGTSPRPRSLSPPPPRLPSPPLSANGVTLLPYGTSNTSDVALPRGLFVASSNLTCTVPPLFLGDSVYNWTVSNNGYIYTNDG
jgi:hypothetical protein